MSHCPSEALTTHFEGGFKHLTLTELHLIYLVGLKRHSQENVQQALPVFHFFSL